MAHNKKRQSLGYSLPVLYMHNMWKNSSAPPPSPPPWNLHLWQGLTRGIHKRVTLVLCAVIIMYSVNCTVCISMQDVTVTLCILLFTPLCLKHKFHEGGRNVWWWPLCDCDRQMNKSTTKQIDRQTEKQCQCIKPPLLWQGLII